MWYLIELDEHAVERIWSGRDVDEILAAVRALGERDIADDGWNRADVEDALAQLEPRVRAAAAGGSGVHEIQGTSKTWFWQNAILVIP